MSAQRVTIFARRVGMDPLSLPWLILPLLILTGMAMIAFIHPDPSGVNQ